MRLHIFLESVKLAQYIDMLDLNNIVCSISKREAHRRPTPGSLKTFDWNDAIFLHQLYISSFIEGESI